MSEDEKLAWRLQQAELGDIVLAGSSQHIVRGMPISDHGAFSASPVVMGAPVAPGDLRLAPGFAADAPPLPEEVAVMSYRLALMCFSTMDASATLFYATSMMLGGQDWLGLILLVSLIGPLCGMSGASRLKRGLVAVYLVFCMGKLALQLAAAAATQVWWLVVLVAIQIWVTKVVASCWRALGAVPPERRRQLLLGGKAPASMVYW